MSVLVTITSSARDDVRQGRDYFENRVTGLGGEFVDEVLITLDRIADMPFAFAEVDAGVRALGLKRFGYVVYYRTEETVVEVIAILHGGRASDAWISRK